MAKHVNLGNSPEILLKMARVACIIRQDGTVEYKFNKKDVALEAIVFFVENEASELEPVLEIGMKYTRPYREARYSNKGTIVHKFPERQPKRPIPEFVKKNILKEVFSLTQEIAAERMSKWTGLEHIIIITVDKLSGKNGELTTKDKYFAKPKSVVFSVSKSDDWLTSNLFQAEKQNTRLINRLKQFARFIRAAVQNGPNSKHDIMWYSENPKEIEVWKNNSKRKEPLLEKIENIIGTLNYKFSMGVFLPHHIPRLLNEISPDQNDPLRMLFEKFLNMNKELSANEISNSNEELFSGVQLIIKNAKPKRGGTSKNVVVFEVYPPLELINKYREGHSGEIQPIFVEEGDVF